MKLYTTNLIFKCRNFLRYLAVIDLLSKPSITFCFWKQFSSVIHNYNYILQNLGFKLFWLLGLHISQA